MDPTATSPRRGTPPPATLCPTWNFAVVHATGKLRPVEDQKQLNDLLARLISKFESYEGTDYDFTKIDETYKYGMMSGIIGFELENRRADAGQKPGGRAEALAPLNPRHLQILHDERHHRLRTREPSCRRRAEARRQGGSLGPTKSKTPANTA